MLKLVVILLYLSKKTFDAVIDYLDTTYIKKKLPENVRDVYNEEEYKNWVAYQKEGGRLDIISAVITVFIELLLLVFNLYACFFRMLSGLNIYLQNLVFVVGFTLALTLISIPFEYYDTFVIEEKYGLNKTTKVTFWLDTVKSYIISAGVIFALISLIMFLFETFGNMAILWCTIAVFLIMLVVSLVIVPLMRIYNRFTPLEEGELKENLLALCEKYGVSVKKIVVRDASRRTTKSNAFCTGLGNRKTISLDDNLVNEYSPEEIVAVFAHEFAHAKYRHVFKSLPFTAFNVLVTFVSLAIVLNLPSLYTEFGFTGTNYYFAFVIMSAIIWPLSTAMNMLGNYLSRKNEYQADAFVAKEGYGKDLISALKRLSKESFSDINPHPAEVILEYSHPTLSQRITAIESEMDSRSLNP